MAIVTKAPTSKLKVSITGQSTPATDTNSISIAGTEEEVGSGMTKKTIWTPLSKYLDDLESQLDTITTALSALAVETWEEQI